jgi:Ca-activated chloride channel family protein
MLVSDLFSDGLMMPADEGYPKEFLRSRLTKVSVDIDGVVARVSVYQEFVNEGEQDVDAVYSFPLPVNARATQFLYWYEDVIYTAVLKVKEQATNPGTGEGGIVAEVNEYIGMNGIKIALMDIPAGKIQKVQLDYIQLVDYFQGSCTFQYPLETGDFITYPLDHLEIDINVKSNSLLNGFEIPDFSDIRILNSSENSFSVQVVDPKSYLNKNIKLTYHTLVDQMEVDFYSVSNDTIPGHFGLFLHPPNQVPADSLLPRRIIFLLSNSSLMFGYKLNQSISAVERTIEGLSENDEFNIGVYNYITQFWQSSPVQASQENIDLAKVYLAEISNGSGSNMHFALEQCLNQIPDNLNNNAIVIFTDGFSYMDPVEIGTTNTNKTGIFPVAIGDNFNFARLEMLAAYNYGFVTYIDLDDNMNLKMSNLMGQITQPILKDVTMEYGKVDLSDILPQKIPSTYAGTYFLMTGRYQNPGNSALSIAGTSKSGQQAYDFMLDFRSETRGYKFIESLWAKQMIDYLEWQIEIYGETEELKNQLIEISLSYNIRCRYTAYIADYETEYPSPIHQIDDQGVFPQHSHLVQNYPNPFNPVTTIVFYISPQGVTSGPRLIKIYNVLGQLVYLIDLSKFGPGYHEIKFNGLDWKGNPLPTGVYFVSLQIGSEQSMMRITLLR